MNGDEPSGPAVLLLIICVSAIAALLCRRILCTTSLPEFASPRRRFLSEPLKVLSNECSYRTAVSMLLRPRPAHLCRHSSRPSRLRQHPAPKIRKNRKITSGSYPTLIGKARSSRPGKSTWKKICRIFCRHSICCVLFRSTDLSSIKLPTCGPSLSVIRKRLASFFCQYVKKEGRLQIVCGNDVMLDVNMPSGESWIRQVLYGKGYLLPRGAGRGRHGGLGAGDFWPSRPDAAALEVGWSPNPIGSSAACRAAMTQAIGISVAGPRWPTKYSRVLAAA